MVNQETLDRWCRGAGYIFIGLFGCLFLYGILHGSSVTHGNAKDIIPALIMLGMCLSISTISVVHSYNAWRMNAKDYGEWSYNELGGGLLAWLKVYVFTKHYNLWSARIIGPIAVAFSLFASLIFFAKILKATIVVLGWE